MTNLLLRFFDILISSAGLVVLSPLFMVLILAGFFDTRSPIFRQVRIGRYEKPFVLFKFRTMKPGTRSVGTHLVESDAVTTYGKFLRKTKMDELPQLWNVLKGDMSLVGPRPCLDNQHELITYRRSYNVFSVRPGITGLAQINGVDMSDPEKLARIDARMLGRFGVGMYFLMLIKTLAGNGSGDNISDD